MVSANEISRNRISDELSQLFAQKSRPITDPIGNAKNAIINLRYCFQFKPESWTIKEIIGFFSDIDYALCQGFNPEDFDSSAEEIAGFLNRKLIV